MTYLSYYIGVMIEGTECNFYTNNTKDEINEILSFINIAWMNLCQHFYRETDGGNLAEVYKIENLANNTSNIVYLQGKNIHEQLGELYQKFLSDKQKKDYGQFYTNDLQIINNMLSDIDLFKGKILEPSCGSGLFLVEICARIIDTMKKRGFSSFEILNYIIDNVYGNDNDKTALIICEINILSILLPLIIETYKKNPKFSLKRIKLKCSDFVIKNNSFKDFSIIIGNPPYITLYGKQSRNMTEEKRAYYNTFDFVQNKKGNNKFNVSMFFIENGLKALKKDGTLVYILDISFLETAYIDIRKYIAEKFCIDKMIYNLSIFENVASGQIIIKISKKNNENNVITLIDYETNKKKYIKQEQWNNHSNKYKYFIPLEDIQSQIINKIEKYNRLDYYFPEKALRTCCALTGKTEEFIVKDTGNKNLLILPYIEGSKGLTGRFTKPITFRKIKYDYNLQLKLSNDFKKELTIRGIKNKKRVTLGDKDAYLSPKIFIRQSANSIISTYCEEPYAANNSIYVLTNKKDDVKSKEFLKYVCGLLNSDLITFYCKSKRIIRTAKGKTPQIKISDLKDVRIVLSNNKYKCLINIVNGLLQNPKDLSLQKELNQTVYSIYGMTEKERIYIQNKINNI